MRPLSALALLFWLTPVTAAERGHCIQSPQRESACPHLLYRAAQLPGMPEPAVICICVSDFTELLRQPKTEAEQIQFNMMQRQMTAIHGEKLQSVVNILRRHQ
jgi:hypothetical protein